MILAWILFAILWNLYKKPRREGVITLTFGLFYGCARLLEDSLRIDKRFGPFTGSQWTALTVATISAAILIWWAIEAHRSPPAGPRRGRRRERHGPGWRTGRSDRRHLVARVRPGS